MINPIKYTPGIQSIRNISVKSNPSFEAQPDVFVKSKDDNNLNPEKLPLSVQIIAGFLAGSADSTKITLPDGKISQLSKTAETPNVKARNIKEELSDKICLKFLDAFGVDYSESEEELLGLFKEYLANIGINIKNKDYEELLSQIKSFGLYDGKNLSKGYRNVYNALYATTLDKEFLFDKKHNAIKQNRQRIEEEMHTSLGVKIYNDFLREIAQEYNLKYETDIK